MSKILAISACELEWLANLDTGHEKQFADDISRAMAGFIDGHYDLVIVDAGFAGEQVADIVSEIKRRSPYVPIFVLLEAPDNELQAELVMHGIDDALPAGTAAPILQGRIELLLHRREENMALARRNHDLHAITLLSRRLHSAENPGALLSWAIDETCTTFNLYGMAIALVEGDNIHLHAGRAGVQRAERPYEATVVMQPQDPFTQVIDRGFALIFEDMGQQAHRPPLPTLPEIQSALLVPLNYGSHTIGAIGVFAQPDAPPLTHDDLMLYELFAAHFASAYYNVQHYHTQSINVQTNRLVLRAWQRLTSLYTVEEITDTLCNLVKQTSIASDVLVWIFDANGSLDPSSVRATQDSAEPVFRKLHNDHVIHQLLDEFNDRMQSLVLTQGRGSDPMWALFNEMRARHLLLVPIYGSLQLLGGAFIAPAGDQPFTTSDANLLESIFHAAGQTLERNTLIGTMQEQAGQLEAIVRSMHEGIFFVNDENQVVFCNPQFTELTGVSPSQVLSRSPQVLMNLLAGRSRDPEIILQQMEEAVAQTLDLSYDEYPIVELSITDLQQSLFLELMPITTHEGTVGGWIGFVQRIDRRNGHADSGTQETIAVEHLLENITLPQSNLQSAITALTEQHGELSYRNRAQMLQQISRQSEDLNLSWRNFMQLYTLEVTNEALDTGEIDIAELIQMVVNNPALSKHANRLHVDMQVQQGQVRADERYLVRALINVIWNALFSSHNMSPVNMQVTIERDMLAISVHDKGLGLTEEQRASLFNPLDENNGLSSDTSRMGLYLAHRVIQRHQGKIEIESRLGWGTVMKVLLPLVGPAVSTSTPSTASRPAQSATLTILVVEGRDALLKPLYGSLEAEGHQLIVTQSRREALSDMRVARIDLVVIDVNIKDGSGLDLCHELRQTSEIPIMILSNQDSEEERIRALRIGADDYVTVPVSNEELMARVGSIAKRKTIPARTSPPVRLGDVHIDFARRLVYVRDELVDLTRIEYDLLHVLAFNQGQVLTHKQLLEKVWGPEYRDETQYLWVNISRLRKKLEPGKDSPRYIHTEPGIGYIFREP